MNRRFTERAREVLFIARDEAEMNQHEYVGTEHILVGILKNGGGLANEVLRQLSVDPVSFCKEVVRSLPENTHAFMMRDIPFTSLARQTLEYSVEEATAMARSSINSEHMLLALARQSEGLAHEMLEEKGATYEKLREKVVAIHVEATK